MEITFAIDGEAAIFSRNWFTGRAAPTSAEKIFELQNPWNPATHLSFQLTQVWEVDVPNHKLVIEKVRPLFFAGFRANAYKVFLDDELVAEKTGR